MAWQALIGGLMIGAASLMLLAFNGRMAGISGIFNNALVKWEPGTWRLFFLVGLILGPAALGPGLARNVSFEAFGWPLLIVGGLLVGFGSGYGSGCTSGHGVCGLGRLSARSLASVVTFMLVAALVVFLTRHVMGA